MYLCNDVKPIIPFRSFETPPPEHLVSRMPRAKPRSWHASAAPDRAWPMSPAPIATSYMANGLTRSSRHGKLAVSRSHGSCKRASEPSESFKSIASELRTGRSSASRTSTQHTLPQIPQISALEPLSARPDSIALQ